MVSRCESTPHLNQAVIKEEDEVTILNRCYLELMVEFTRNIFNQDILSGSESEYRKEGGTKKHSCHTPGAFPAHIVSSPSQILDSNHDYSFNVGAFCQETNDTRVRMSENGFYSFSMVTLSSNTHSPYNCTKL